MSKVDENLPFNFPSKKPLEVRFSALDLSTDAGLLLIKQAETNLQICQGITNCLEDQREQHKIRHSLSQLISQRIYQIVAGYEDAVDSNYLRHDPIFKIICGKISIIGAELLASQPTISRLENQITASEIKRIRRFYVDKFIESYQSKPKQIILDIDGWDALTYGEQQLSLFHGYYGHKIYFPCLINEAKSGYPLILQLRPGNSHSAPGDNWLIKMVILAVKKSMVRCGNYLAGRWGFFFA